MRYLSYYMISDIYGITGVHVKNGKENVKKVGSGNYEKALVYNSFEYWSAGNDCT